jgi:hypothetical protein
MTILEVIGYTLCFGGLIIGGIALLIYWLIFKRDYYTALARYKALVDGTPIADLDNIYNKEFPADFSIKEIKEWMKGEGDDTEAS